MRIEEFFNKYGSVRYRAVEGSFVEDCDGIGYKSPETAQMGFYRAINDRKKRIRLKEWREFKTGPWGQYIVKGVTGKKLSYKLLEYIIKYNNIKCKFSVPVLYNLIKGETNKESCYTV